MHLILWLLTFIFFETGQRESLGLIGSVLDVHVLIHVVAFLNFDTLIYI